MPDKKIEVEVGVMKATVEPGQDGELGTKDDKVDIKPQSKKGKGRSFHKKDEAPVKKEVAELFKSAVPVPAPTPKAAAAPVPVPVPVPVPAPPAAKPAAAVVDPLKGHIEARWCSRGPVLALQVLVLSEADQKSLGFFVTHLTGKKAELVERLLKPEERAALAEGKPGHGVVDVGLLKAVLL